MQLTLLHTFSLLVQCTYGQLWKPFPGSVSSIHEERLDIFYKDNQGGIWHKYHANAKAGWRTEKMASDVVVQGDSIPVTATLYDDQIHVFVNTKGVLKYKYWDGSQWQPTNDWQTLGFGIKDDSKLTVTKRGNNRFHVIGVSTTGEYVQKYYDGTTWKPDDPYYWEPLGNHGLEAQGFSSAPAANSWGPDRLDIFGIISNKTLVHKYWDGSSWQPSIAGWEQWGDKSLIGDPAVTSWSENRLDAWAVTKGNKDDGSLSHRYWDGSSLSDWEKLGDGLKTAPSITHWEKNRIDIFGLRGSQIVYKYWDGGQWNPSANGDSSWYNHSSKIDFQYEPVSVSWGKNNVNVFGVDSNRHIRWQFWEGSQWLPAADGFYDLGPIEDVKSSKDNNQEKPALIGQGEENIDL